MRSVCYTIYLTSGYYKEVKLNDVKNEEKIYKCNKCGGWFTAAEMVRKVNNGNVKFHVCKECENKYRREKRQEIKIEKFLADESLRICRKYKVIRPERTLSVEESGIALVADDEVFVRLLDYRDSWISNYGRMITKYNGGYHVKHKRYNDDSEVVYKLYKNVYDGKRWIFREYETEAWKLVVQEFIVNYDVANNTKCWHRGNDKSDNCYRNIYPLNGKEYTAVQQDFLQLGIDTEESILAIMNSVEYRPDGWKPDYMMRTTLGIGYL